ncbi:MAG: YDG domain-containing protein, partial [Terriglobales bacterium]
MRTVAYHTMRYGSSLPALVRTYARLAMMLLLGLALASAAAAQVAHFDTPPVSLGTVNLIPDSVGIPYASEASLEVTFDSASAGVSAKVLTEGAPGGDFQLIGGSCVDNGPTLSYPAGAICVIEIQFEPTEAGERDGAVELLVNNQVVATDYVHGVGAGPQLLFEPGTQSTLGSSLRYPSGLATDGSGSVYVADAGNNRVVKETLSNGSYTQSVLASGVTTASGVAVDGAGNVYIAAESGGQVLKETPANGAYTQSVVASGLSAPSGVAVDNAGNVYIADTGNNRVLEETLANGAYTESTVVSGLQSPLAVAVDGNGNVYIANTSGYDVLKETPAHGAFAQSVVLSGLGGLEGVAVDGSGNVYISDYVEHEVLKETPSGATYIQNVEASGLNGPEGLAVDGSGNLYIALAGASQVVKIDRTNPSLAFPTTGISTSSPAQTLTLVNNGSVALTFTDTNYTGPSSDTDSNYGYLDPFLSSQFARDPDSTCPRLVTEGNSATLAAGAACTEILRFVPAAVGTVNGSLTFADNNLGGEVVRTGPDTTEHVAALQTVALEGTAVQGTQTINFPAPGPQVYGVDLDLNASSSAGLPITYTVNSGPATVSGSLLIFTGPGMVNVTASQPGSSLYTAAAPVALSISVAPATLTISGLSVSQKAYDGTNHATLSGTAVLVGVIGKDEVSLVGTPVATFPQVHPGSSLPISLTGNWSLAGAKAGNYTLVEPTFLSSILKADIPGLSWPTPAPIPYGTPLGAAQLDATAGIPGTFTYDTRSPNSNEGPVPAEGIILPVGGSGRVVAEFTPTDTVDYASGCENGVCVYNDKFVYITVTPAPLTITGLSAVSKRYDGATTASLSGTAALSGIVGSDQVSLVGTPVAVFAQSGVGTGIAVTVSGYTLTGAQAGNYTLTEPILSASITRATPSVSWTAPSPIGYGAVLGATQLDATAPVPGTFTYTPAAGAILAAGSQSLSVTFTPTDAADYASVTSAVALSVTRAPLTITGLSAANKPYDGATAASLSGTAVLSGIVGNDAVSLAGTPAGAFAQSGVGTGIAVTVSGYTLTGAQAANYSLIEPTLSASITRATPSVSWTAPSAVVYGTALSATQLDASAPVPGTFTYTPAIGAILAV